MPLTSAQLSEIKDFIHSRGFTHIEVEMEILDHVASAVEAKLESNPNKSITKAIHEVHAGFGPLGFSVMEDELRKNYGKQFGIIQRDLLWSYFSSVKAIITVLVFLLSYLIGEFILPQPIVIIQVILCSVCLISGILLYHQFRSMFRKWRKRSLIIGSHFIKSWVVYYFIIYGLRFYGEWLFQFSQYSTLIFASLLTVILISTLFAKDVVIAAFNWTNERYLKYATH